MPKIDIRMGEIDWPQACCRCAGAEFSYRTRTENVVTRTVITATESRAITLANVPVCDRCEHARSFWYAGAAVAAAVGLGMLYFGAAESAGGIMLTMFVLAVLLAIVATRKSPIRIIRFDERNNSLKVQVYNRAIADEMRRREAARQDLDGHAEYLATQEKIQRKKDREVRLTVRTLCLFFFALGVYLVAKLGEPTGYTVMFLSLAFCLPFEIKHLRTK
jgi:hypothetical protein